MPLKTNNYTESPPQKETDTDGYEDILSAFEEPVIERNFVPNESLYQPEPEPETETEDFTEDESLFEDEPVMDKETLEILGEMNKTSAEVLVNVGNNLIAFFIAAFVAGNIDLTSRFKLDSEAEKHIQTLIKQMMPRDKALMPNWLQLLIIIPASYAPIISEAAKYRKHKNQE